MKKKNGYTAVDLLIVIVVFGVLTFITISKVSYALSDDKSELYKMETQYIEMQAINYGNTKLDELKEKEMTVTVNHLINENFLEADDESGNIYNPMDKSETLNDKKIKLTYDEKNSKIKAKLED